jgi:hypothetical protein
MVESFDSNRNAREFIQNYEVLSMTWTEEDRCHKLGQYLKGPSAHWFEFMQKESTVRNRFFGSIDKKKWDDMRSAFLGEFDNSGGIEWYTTTQSPGELGLSFLYRALNLYGSTVELEYKDSYLVEIIVEKLTPWYKREVKDKRPRGFEELKEILKSIDTTKKTESIKEEGSISKKKNKIKRRLCYRCRLKGHVARKCPVERNK